MLDSIMQTTWWSELVSTLLVGVVSVLGFYLRKLIVMGISKMEASDVQKKAVDCVLEGMAKAQDELVRQAKQAAEDGKLTKEEVKQAEKIAITHAISVATGPVKDLILSWSQERLSSVIKQLLNNFKSEKK